LAHCGPSRSQISTSTNVPGTGGQTHTTTQHLYERCGQIAALNTNALNTNKAQRGLQPQKTMAAFPRTPTTAGLPTGSLPEGGSAPPPPPPQNTPWPRCFVLQPCSDVLPGTCSDLQQCSDALQCNCCVRVSDVLRCHSSVVQPHSDVPGISRLFFFLVQVVHRNTCPQAKDASMRDQMSTIR